MHFLECFYRIKWALLYTVQRKGSYKCKSYSYTFIYYRTSVNKRYKNLSFLFTESWPRQFWCKWIRLLPTLADCFCLKKLYDQVMYLLHLDNVFCICISLAQRLQCHWSDQHQLSVQLLAMIMRPRSDSDNDVSDNDSEMSRLRRKGSHADLQLEWSVLSWERGSPGESDVRGMLQTTGVLLSTLAEDWWSW